MCFGFIEWAVRRATIETPTVYIPRQSCKRSMFEVFKELLPYMRKMQIAMVMFCVVPCCREDSSTEIKKEDYCLL